MYTQIHTLVINQTRKDRYYHTNTYTHTHTNIDKQRQTWIRHAHKHTHIHILPTGIRFVLLLSGILKYPTGNMEYLYVQSLNLELLKTEADELDEIRVLKMDVLKIELYIG